MTPTERLLRDQARRFCADPAVRTFAPPLALSDLWNAAEDGPLVELDFAAEAILTAPEVRWLCDERRRLELTHALAACRGWSILNLENELDAEAMQRADKLGPVRPRGPIDEPHERC